MRGIDDKVSEKCIKLDALPYGFFFNYIDYFHYAFFFDYIPRHHVVLSLKDQWYVITVSNL
jgi:hypothetical protein